MLRGVDGARQSERDAARRCGDEAEVPEPHETTEPTAESVPASGAPAPRPSFRRATPQELAVLAVGDAVRHKAYGEGRVVSIGGGMIKARFGDKDLMYSFPGGFERGFLGL